MISIKILFTFIWMVVAGIVAGKGAEAFLSLEDKWSERVDVVATLIAILGIVGSLVVLPIAIWSF